MPIDHTQFPPDKWQQILELALADLRLDHNDAEALQAIRDANEALNAYEQPAIQAGINAEQPVRSALSGLSKVPGDVLRGIANTFTHPIQTIRDIPKIPGAVWEGMSSGDPEQIARTVGNVGAMALPFAKAKGSLSTIPFTARAAAAGGRTIGAMTGEVVARPFRAAGEMLARPGLKNKLLTEQLEGAQLSNETMRANLNKPPARVAGLAEEQLAARQLMNERLRAQATEPPVRVEGMAQEQLIGRQLQNELLKQRLEAAGETVPIEPPIPMSPVAPVAPKPIPEPMPGTPGGYTVEGPPTPPIRTEPTLIEMQQGFKEPPIPRKGQKALEFSPKGQKTAYSTETQTEFKTLLGELARSLRGK